MRYAKITEWGSAISFLPRQALVIILIHLTIEVRAAPVLTEMSITSLTTLLMLVVTHSKSVGKVPYSHMRGNNQCSHDC